MAASHMVAQLTLDVADSGSRTPPTDFVGGITFSTSTLSNNGINFLAVFAISISYSLDTRTKLQNHDDQKQEMKEHDPTMKNTHTKKRS